MFILILLFLAFFKVQLVINKQREAVNWQLIVVISILIYSAWKPGENCQNLNLNSILLYWCIDDNFFLILVFVQTDIL